MSCPRAQQRDESRAMKRTKRAPISPDQLLEIYAWRTHRVGAASIFPIAHSYDACNDACPALVSACANRVLPFQTSKSGEVTVRGVENAVVFDGQSGQMGIRDEVADGVTFP